MGNHNLNKSEIILATEVKGHRVFQANSALFENINELTFFN